MEDAEGRLEGADVLIKPADEEIAAEWTRGKLAIAPGLEGVRRSRRVEARSICRGGYAGYTRDTKLRLSLSFTSKLVRVYVPPRIWHVLRVTWGPGYL